MAKPILAILYDFDKTLSTTDMQAYKLIPDLGMSPDEFWEKTGEFSAKTGAERILSYMYMIMNTAKERGIKLTRKYLQECGKNIEYYPGVEDYFKRLNKYGEEHGVQVEHYLVSSGTLEIVEGSKIFKEFKKAYGCEFIYGDDGAPIWPKLAINFTQKTQFYFRIAKGAFEANDDKSVNEKIEKKDELRVPYRNIVYLGDGMTDIACMTLVKKNGGNSIAVYSNEDSKNKVDEIKKDNRVNFIAEADYSKGKAIDNILKSIINQIELSN